MENSSGKSSLGKIPRLSWKPGTKIRTFGPLGNFCKDHLKQFPLKPGDRELNALASGDSPQFFTDLG